MDIQLLLHDRIQGRRVPVLLQADPDSAMTTVVQTLSEVAGGQTLYLGQQPLRTDGRLGESGLRQGTVLSVGRPDLPAAQRSGWELVVIGGPDAGRVEPLGFGSTIVGNVPGSGPMIDDRTMRSRHFELYISNEFNTVTPLVPDGPLFIDGDPVGDTTEISEEQVLHVGTSLIAIRRAPVPDADITVPYGPTLEFNRPPRIRPPKVAETTFTVPMKPSFDPEDEPFPWVQVFAPLVFAIAGAALFGQLYFLLFGLLSPVMALGTLWERNRRNERKEKRERSRYVQKRRKVEAEAKHASIVELHARRYLYPDVVTVSDLAAQPCKRLWERRREDPDFLELRVGTATMPAGVSFSEMHDDKPPQAPKLVDAPVTFDLKEAGLLGVAAGLAKRHAVGRWLVTQAAALHSPRDLRLFLFTNNDAAAEWDWFRWLPHARGEGENAPFVNVASDQYEHDDMVRYLLAVCEERTERMRSRDFGREQLQAYVLVLDGVRELRARTGLPRLLREGPKVGIYAIGLDSVSSRLAEEGRAELVIENDLREGARLLVSDRDPIGNMSVDLVDVTWSERAARAMAPLVDVTGTRSGNDLPNSASFVDLLDIDLDSPTSVIESWRRLGRTTTAAIGVDADGLFVLDLRRDGPHALIAGTTGAGKSEFLQTLVASLAFVNRPEAINFVLVDYKGGSAFSDCALLPHTVGLVTDLDNHLTQRALTALNAELKRRETLLKQINTPDIDTAWRQDPKTASAGLARLVIVIDEFAELVRELPDFVEGLVRIARVGRSLGVHLILATQRPTGVVSPEIKSNTGLRVALRMEDKADSLEVLEKPDAADISRATPGRGFARLGGAGSIFPFQAARIAGRRRGRSEGLPDPVAMTVPWKRLGVPVPRSEETQNEDELTDLHFLVQRIVEAAETVHAIPQPAPWLPPLPKRWVVPSIAAASHGDATFALEDRPGSQSQPIRRFDLEHDGHLMIAGTARSGRSSALRTLAAAIADAWSPNDCHLYGLDFGNGALLPLAELPHCGAVMARHEHERIERFIEKLLDEIGRRQQFLARSGFGDVAEQRRNAAESERLPFIVLLLDQWDGFVAEFPLDTASEHHDRIMQIVREGPSAGVRVLITGDRSLLLHRLSSSIDERFVLRLANNDDYGIAGLRGKAIPEHMPPGRALHASGTYEMQFALLTDSLEVSAQVAVLRDVARVTIERTPLPLTHAPFRVDALPTEITYEETRTLLTPSNAKSPLAVLCGVGGDTLATLWTDLQADGPYLVIAGQSKTGRSTAALTMARSVHEKGTTVIAVTPKASPLRTLAANENVYVFRGDDSEADPFTAALDNSDGPVLVVVDNSELINGTEIEGLIVQAASGKVGEVAVVVVGLLEDMQSQLVGLAVEARKSRLGLLFSPQSAIDGDVIGVRLPRNVLGRQPVGRGILCTTDAITAVQVPAP